MDVSIGNQTQTLIVFEELKNMYLNLNRSTIISFVRARGLIIITCFRYTVLQ